MGKTFTWRGTTYALPNHNRPRSRAGLSIEQIDYNAEIRTLKGLRTALVLQQRTEWELLDLKLSASKRELAQAEMFPFAHVQESRKSYRDPRRLDGSDKVLRNLSQGFYEHVPTYKDSAGDTHYMEWCGECDQWMRREAFSPKTDAASGLHPYCKTCRAEKERLRYAERKEQIAAAA